MGGELLEINNLRTSFKIGQEYFAAVDGVSFSVKQNEVFAIVGESGCGKSALALSILRLHKATLARVEGSIKFKGEELLTKSEYELNKIRGRDVGMIFQDPLTALNPLMKIGAQIEESLALHTDFNAASRKECAISLLHDVGMVDPGLSYSQLPHELSGGMRQRAMIAIALACKPSLIIADEPTTALDVTIQAQILDLLRKLQDEMKTGVIIITHDLGVVAELADRVAVMYAGQIVELARVEDIFNSAKHPYTRSLLASNPGMMSLDNEYLQVIEGMVPSLANLPRSGCRFSDRIPWIPREAHEDSPQYHEISPGHTVLCSCYGNFSFKDSSDAV